MPSGFNRALQVRVANRLRAQLARDAVTGLPLIDTLSQSDQRELCEVGGGRLAAVVITCADATGVGKIVAVINGEVRRTDLLGIVQPAVLLVLAPALEPVGGQSLVDRLSKLLRTQGTPGETRIGVAYRSVASSSWTARMLADEAATNALNVAPADATAIAS